MIKKEQAEQAKCSENPLFRAIAKYTIESEYLDLGNWNISSFSLYLVHPNPLYSIIPSLSKNHNQDSIHGLSKTRFSLELIWSRCLARIIRFIKTIHGLKFCVLKRESIFFQTEYLKENLPYASGFLSNRHAYVLGIEQKHRCKTPKSWDLI